MSVNEVETKQKITKVLDELPAEKMAEILDFATFIKQRFQSPSRAVHRIAIKTVPATRLRSLAGIVAWGGDAITDTERLYE